MPCEQNTISAFHTSYRPFITKASLATCGIAAFIIGVLSHLHVITGVNAVGAWTLIGSGLSVELVLFIYCRRKPKKEACNNGEKAQSILTQVHNREPIGFFKSPYSAYGTLRFLANYMTNGRFSYVNPDHKNMQLLRKEGTITLRPGNKSASLKIIFLGDIMASKSGDPPQLDARMRKLLKSAHVIVANVEAPIINTAQKTPRGLTLKFEMSNHYLKSFYDYNPEAQWVFSIANNHAFDTSDQDEEDVSGVLTTIDSIGKLMPDAEIIGTEIGTAKSGLSLKIPNGPEIGIIAWTEIMNSDNYHYKKKILRESDMTEQAVTTLRSTHDILIGFPHGNEEQSFHPLKKTRDHWCQLTGPDKFDVIVGHGPHVVHPAELVNERVIFHSIGNFCSPIGPSQSRVGCIPEIDLQYDQDGKALSMHYTVHLLEQGKECVSLMAGFDEKSTIYPEIIRRFEEMWKPLMDC